MLPPEIIPAETVDPAATAWDEHCGVLVVGFGAAGAAAALEAARGGGRVVLCDRFAGGGATAQSGGIYYAGGGSRQQVAAGYADSPAQMADYLREELDGNAPEDQLRAFCDESLDNLAFLEEIGVPFPPTGDAPKTSYPANDVTLYFSGNELSVPFADRAEPAPRGHRSLGRGLTGNVFFSHLRRAVEAEGAITVWRQARVARLLRDAAGRVVSAEVVRGPDGALARVHALVARLGGMLALFGPGFASAARRVLGWIERGRVRTLRVRADGGVVLAAGGFIFNRDMVARHAPLYRKVMTLGTLGDDGAGIALGRGAGGRARHLDQCTAWRFINPPFALTRGVLVDLDGQRIVNEELYGARLGTAIAGRRDGRAYLVIDDATRREVVAELRSRKPNFQSYMAFVFLFWRRVRADGIEALARAAGIEPGTLLATIERYNEDAAKGLPDAFGKMGQSCRPLATAPFHALSLDADHRAAPAPTLSLGGLETDFRTGAVLGEDGMPISGLFAAGRNAVGICTHGYVSGLSLADCIFSGRHAGRAAAQGSSA